MDAKLEVESVLKNWNAVKLFIEKNISEYVKDKSLMYKIILSCEEIFVNMCSYAYENKIGIVNLEVYGCHKFIKVIFIDEGVEFDPTKFETKSINDRIKNSNFGGLGILLVKKNMDIVKYKRLDSKNVLTIIKNLGSDNIEQ